MEPQDFCVLFKELTNADHHRMGNHAGCGPACEFSGMDLRPSPVFDLVTQVQEYGSRISRATLYRAMKAIGLPVTSRMKKRELLFVALGRKPVDEFERRWFTMV